MTEEDKGFVLDDLCTDICFAYEMINSSKSCGELVFKSSLTSRIVSITDDRCNQVSEVIRVYYKNQLDDLLKRLSKEMEEKDAVS